MLLTSSTNKIYIKMIYLVMMLWWYCCVSLNWGIALVGNKDFKTRIILIEFEHGKYRVSLRVTDFLAISQDAPQCFSQSFFSSMLCNLSLIKQLLSSRAE